MNISELKDYLRSAEIAGTITEAVINSISLQSQVKEFRGNVEGVTEESAKFVNEKNLLAAKRVSVVLIGNPDVSLGITLAMPVEALRNPENTSASVSYGVIGDEGISNDEIHQIFIYD